MLNNQKFINLITVGLLLIGAEPTIAQSMVNNSASIDRSITHVSFEPPSDDKKPDNTSGAGSRQDQQCPQDSAPATPADTPSDKSSLMALVPTTNYGLTLTERPTFWVYLPETSAKQVVLSIREEGINHHSQTFFPITGEPGLLGIKPLDDSPPLDVGKSYQWAVVLVCGERPGPNDPALASWVRRIAPSKPMNQETALEQAVWYGEQGIWYDALTALAQARRAQPDNKDLADIWAGFLKSAGLEAIATEPLRF